MVEFDGIIVYDGGRNDLNDRVPGKNRQLVGKPGKVRLATAAAGTVGESLAQINRSFRPLFQGGTKRAGPHHWECLCNCDPAAQEGCAYLYLFEITSGGMGLTSGIFDYFLLAMARERLCVCEHCDPDSEFFDRGCPPCIQVPRWYEDNDKLGKCGFKDIKLVPKE